MEQLSALFRKYFPPAVFQSELYLSNLARYRAETNMPDAQWIERGNERFAISSKTPVYLIRRDTFNYYFIDEGDAFKLFHVKLFYVNLLPNFRLF